MLLDTGLNKVLKFFRFFFKFHNYYEVQIQLLLLTYLNSHLNGFGEISGNLKF